MRIPITTQNGAGVEVATVLTVWMIPKKQRIEGHSLRSILIEPVTRVDAGHLSYENLTENDAAYTLLSVVPEYAILCYIFC